MSDKTLSLQNNVSLNLGKAAPATSATSDAPVEVTTGPALSVQGSEFAPPPAPTPTAAPTPDATQPPTPTEAPKTPEVTEAPKVEDKVETADEKTPPWMKAEITKIRNQKRDSDARAAAAEDAAKEATKRLELALEALAKTGQEATDPTKVARPQLKDFEDPQAYEDALIDWASKTAEQAARVDEQRKIQEQTEAQAREARETQAKEEHEKVITKWTERRTEALEKYPDYEAVAEADDVQISFPMTQIILNSENGPDVAYYLGTHKEDAARIASLVVPNQYILGQDGKPVVNEAGQAIPLPNVGLQMFEMGKLMAKMELESRPAVSQTPPPPKRESGSNESVPDPDREPSMDEYAAKRLPQIRGERRN